jgi:proteasome accessory factor B
MQRVIERILNLLAFLLTVQRPVGADEIRNTVAGYDRESDVAFHRTFERDKALLRSLGIPIEREATDAFEVEFGYVVDDEEYALADPGLTDEESVALSLAVQAVGFGGRSFAEGALMKLGGAASSAGGTQLGADLGERADDVAAAFEAISERRILRFGYRGTRRRVRPYGLVHRRGHWYLVAEEGDGDVIKVFRLDRASSLEGEDPKNAFVHPEGFAPADWVAKEPWEAGEESTIATVAFDREVAWIAEREMGQRAAITPAPDGSIVAEIEVASPSAFVGWILGFEDRAEILSPESIRDRLVSLVEAR